jgi:hypothetical protein
MRIDLIEDIGTFIDTKFHFHIHVNQIFLF